MSTIDNPFIFYSRLHLIEMTGIKASTLPELLENMRKVPGSCIYHHTHHFIQRHQYLSPEPPNDFAYWVSEGFFRDRSKVVKRRIWLDRYGGLVEG